MDHALPPAPLTWCRAPGPAPALQAEGGARRAPGGSGVSHQALLYARTEAGASSHAAGPSSAPATDFQREPHCKSAAVRPPASDFKHRWSAQQMRGWSQAPGWVLIPAVLRSCCETSLGLVFPFCKMEIKQHLPYRDQNKQNRVRARRHMSTRCRHCLPHY